MPTWIEWILCKCRLSINTGFAFAYFFATPCSTCDGAVFKSKGTYCRNEYFVETIGRCGGIRNFNAIYNNVFGRIENAIRPSIRIITKKKGCTILYVFFHIENCTFIGEMKTTEGHLCIWYRCF